ncbi:hypothetical protein BGZ68_008936 [Mortierella alpina]|nr:hypothetical protein BGZ68_008936 [Mortierella alpina]
MMQLGRGLSKLLDLESCEIPWFDENTDPSELTEVVRKHCPKLKHLKCPSFRDHELDGHRVDSFILGCTQLQSFVSHHFSDHEPESEPRHIISTLASQHSETLEVLELTECHQVFSRDQQAILSRCKRLKQFWVMNCYPDETDIGIESTDIRENWVCMELTKLGLTLNRYPMMENVIGELDGAMGSALDMEIWDEIGACILADADKRVYTQIGRLAKLEILALDIVAADEQTNALRGDYAWDLTLSHGWLGEMAGLKSLKSLRLEADFWSEMGQAEMEFMHEQWPSLREITLRGNVLLLGGGSPWRWLLTKRPHLRLDVAQ